jgi:hypothetical protein
MRNWNVIVHGGTRSTRGFLEGNMGPNFATLSTVFYFILCKYSPGSDKIARSSANHTVRYSTYLLKVLDQYKYMSKAAACFIILKRLYDLTQP